MIRERKLADGRSKYDVEIRINGDKYYKSTFSLEEAERFEGDMILKRSTKPSGPQSDMDRFLRMALI